MFFPCFNFHLVINAPPLNSVVVQSLYNHMMSYNLIIRQVFLRQWFPVVCGLLCQFDQTKTSIILVSTHHFPFSCESANPA